MIGITTNPSVDAVTTAAFPSSLLDITEVALARTPSPSRGKTVPRRRLCMTEPHLRASHVRDVGGVFSSPLLELDDSMSSFAGLTHCHQ